MGWSESAVLFVAAALAGGINAIAGGGSIIVFPLQVLLGVPPLRANATGTAALVPASLASAWGYRSDLSGERPLLIRLSVVSLLGGALGALGVLSTPDAVLLLTVPGLLAAAALIFTFGEALRTRLAKLGAPPFALVALAQFLISLYGGYFGGGMGLMMLAVFSLLGPRHLNAMNGLKSVLGVAINGAALALFVWRGAVDWPHALVMMAGAVLGGYFTASRARTIDAKLVRKAVIVLAWCMTAVLAYRTYL